MEISEKHQSCKDCIKDKRPLIEKISIKEREEWESDISENKLIFIKGDSVCISYEKNFEEELSDEKIILLPAGCKIYILAKNNTSIIIVRLHYRINFCKKIPYKQLLKRKRILDSEQACEIIEKQAFNGYCLKMDRRIKAYTDNLEDRLSDGLACTEFFELKQKELFLLLSTYYDKDELAVFFEPLMHSDLKFSNIILNNYLQVKTIKDLAELTNYSISGFEKRFRKVFKVSAGQWLMQKKSSDIYFDINMGESAFKDLCYKYGFSSLSNFNNYCKLHFGKTPGEIRRQGKGV